MLRSIKDIKSVIYKKSLVSFPFPQMFIILSEFKTFVTVAPNTCDLSKSNLSKGP